MFVIDLSQMISSSFFKINLWCQIGYKKETSRMHIILGLLCWMNEKYDHIQQFPLSTTKASKHEIMRAFETHIKAIPFILV